MSWVHTTRHLEHSLAPLKSAQLTTNRLNIVWKQKKTSPKKNCHTYWIRNLKLFAEWFIHFAWICRPENYILCSSEKHICWTSYLPETEKIWTSFVSFQPGLVPSQAPPCIRFSGVSPGMELGWWWCYGPVWAARRRCQHYKLYGNGETERKYFRLSIIYMCLGWIRFYSISDKNFFFLPSCFYVGKT